MEVLHHFGGDDIAADAARAARLYEEALEEDCELRAVIANKLASLLENGSKDLACDVSRSRKLYQLAIDHAQHPGAMFNLGVLLRHSDPESALPLDRENAETLLSKAAGSGAPVCSQNLESTDLCVSLDTKNDLSASALSYSIAIEEKNDVRGMNNLAVLLQLGGNEVSKDVARAKRLYSRAICEGAHVRAMQNFASLLMCSTDSHEVGKENEELASVLLARSREIDQC